MHTLGTLAALAMLAGAIALPATADARPRFIAGADFSHAGFFEGAGKVYRENGVAVDPFVLLKRSGVTCVRLRLYTSSAEQAAGDPYNSINNLAYTVPLAVRARKAGLDILLDFHYSDTWADPAHQTMPRAWNALTFEELERRMYEYNRDCIAAFKAAGALPDYVQVGNEITGGMLWPAGQVGGERDTPAQWDRLAWLMKAAIRGIDQAAGRRRPKIIVHIDRGGDWKTTEWFFDHLTARKVDFDIVGQSYYPFWHGTLGDLNTCLTNAAERYQKPVIVAETDFPWTAKHGAEKIVGMDPDIDGQCRFALALAKVVKGVPHGRGLGIFWWGSEYLPLDGTNLAGFEDRSFFDHDGNALPILKTFGGLSEASK